MGNKLFDGSYWKEVTDQIGQDKADSKALTETSAASDGPRTAELASATKVMAERLERHFKFDFGEGPLIDDTPSVKCCPVVYGGYAPDGSIVGILTSRSAYED